jgi:hypothetical protein
MSRETPSLGWPQLYAWPPAPAAYKFIGRNVMTTNTDELQDALEGSPISCFVVGPIGDRDASRDSPERQTYEEAIMVWEEVILPACEGFGISPLRADHIATSGEIPEQVFRRLRDDTLVIADLTGANPNVMYELGLRHTTGKLTIQIGERSRLPFDVSSIRTIIFRRTEAGLIDARKRLAQAIGAGLQHGGDPVSATRVWFEIPILSRPTDTQVGAPAADDEEPGILEKLADMLEGLGSSTRIATTIGTVTMEIGELAKEAAGQNERVNQHGGAPGAKIEITNKLARRLDDPATRLEVLAGEYGQSIERLNPGVIYVLNRLRVDPGARQEAGDFPGQIMNLILSVEGTMQSLEGFKASLVQSGEATRELRKVNRRIAGSVSSIIAASSRMSEWRQLLESEEPREEGAS